MRNKLLNIGLLLSFLLCYVDMGHDGHEFMFQMDYSLLSNLTDDSTFLPTVFLILGGQLSLLLAVFFDNRAYKLLTAVGLIWLTIFALIIAGMSLMVSYWHSFLSTIPYFILTVFTILTLARRQQSK